MALRTKTLWFATQRVADATDATLSALPQITVYAENSSRTFRSCLVWISFEDIITATGGTITEHRVACSVNGAGATTITETDDIAHSGENMAGVIGPFDFTSHFATNFPAANSATLDLSVYFDQNTGTTLNMRNIGALIAITYEYDDAASTQYATAIIPMESTTGALATSETEIGTNQIPQLTGSGGLLENVASVVVRQQFFIVEGNDESNANATDYTLNVRIDTGTTHTFSVTEKALASDCYKRFIHIESPSTSAVHQWKAWTASAGRLNHCTHTMYVTYEFAIAGTTSFLNSILIPFEMPSPMGGDSAALSDRFTRTIYVEEPGTITLRQSAYRIQFYPGAAVLAGLNTRAGGQTYRTYTPNSSFICGNSALQQRIDSGGAQGAGMTLARGRNNISIDLYRTDTADLGWNISGLIILNYTSGVSAQGPSAHNHTTVWKIMDWDAGLTVLRDQTPTPPNIPETNYWVTAIGYQMIQWDLSSVGGLQWSAEVLAGEGDGDGWRPLYTDIFIKDNERSCQIVYCRARDDFDRWPNDTDTSRLAIESSRIYRYVTTTASANGVAMLLTYHTITFTVGGDISGSVGGTVDIDVFQEIGDEILHIGSTSRSGDGAYSLTWYDNVHDCYAEARESGILIGRSDNGTATGSP